MSYAIAILVMFMSKHKRKIKMMQEEGKRMNMVLPINEQKENLNPPKKDFNKKNLVSFKKSGDFSREQMKKLYELQQRSSSSDEYPLLWEEEKK